MIVLANPFFVYFSVFTVSLALYALGWATVLPPLTGEVIAFFIVTGAIALTLAFMHRKTIRSAAYQPEQLPWWVGPLFVVFAIADLLYTGYIPFVAMMQQSFAYGGFTGIPTIHSLGVTLGSVYSTIRFADFLKTKKARYLAEAILPLIYMILVVYRGPATIVLSAWLFVFILHVRKLDLKLAASLAIVGLIGLYGFGAMGNQRTAAQSRAHAAPIIDLISQPSEWFLLSGIPSEYMWTYFYAASPVGVFQSIVNDISPLDRPETFIVDQLLPDFISKRFLAAAKLEQADIPALINSGNVATMFGRSYMYIGWAGPAILFGFLCALISAYLHVTRHSPYQMPCIALTCLLMIYSPFDNTISYSTISFQLIWALLLPGREGWAWMTRVFQPRTGRLLAGNRE